MNPSEQVGRVARGFAVPGDPIEVRPLLGGHIHDSYVVTIGASGRRYLLQRINEEVFHDCDGLMENVSRVTGHLSGKARKDGDSSALKKAGTQVWHRLPAGENTGWKPVPHNSQRTDRSARRFLSLVETIDGGSYHRDAAGAAWRMYVFLDETVSFEAAPDAERACEAAMAFGAFQADLIDLPGSRLCETIPGFHDTTARYEALKRAIQDDRVGRAASVNSEIEFAGAHREQACALIELWRGGVLPERVVHNDAKISNVLFDSEGRSWVCVVDLDTVMPGLVLFDFGDMVRSMTCFAAEDETDLSRVEVDLGMFEALARGYIESTQSFLSSVERDGLAAAGIAITLEQGVRFLTDHLEGDRYYAVSRTGHNLDRARAQFKLAESMIRRAGEMERIVSGLAGT